VTLTLVALLATALGWLWGHSTARIRIIPIGATDQQDAAALEGACCETAWLTRGHDHDNRCQQDRRTV
jgi:hypothetical protein